MEEDLMGEGKHAAERHWVGISDWKEVEHYTIGKALGVSTI
jgi:hypothetical protein